MQHRLGDVAVRSRSLAPLRSLFKELPSPTIRKSFFDYFCQQNGHLYVRSSPVFSLKDPTLAFVNAGMNQFKDVFLGTLEPPAKRVANSQKCIRVGGKHNDLAQVGNDGSHHTFFEMLGNWSFGDYFKEKACSMSWELLTKVFKIPPERLYVTYFGGDESLGLEADLEVREIWRELGVIESHILPFGVKDNFWEGGSVGPCGPCTEIHYDHCPRRTNAEHLVNTGLSDLTEIWNLVFTQYNRKADGSLETLQKQFVDTGMGFERLVAVLQEKTFNYDTDLFTPLFEVIKKHSGHSGYAGKYDGNEVDCSYRILADHSRMIAVALSDGMLPSQQNKVRMVLKRALGVAEKVFRTDYRLLKELTNHVAESFQDVYPEIGNNLGRVHSLIEKEASLWQKQRQDATDRWMKITKKYPVLEGLDIAEVPQMIQGMEYIEGEILNKGFSTLRDKDCWTLFDTYGVSIDFTEKLASKLGLAIEMESFKEYEAKMKMVSRKEGEKMYFGERNSSLSREVLAELVEMKLKPTADYFKHDYRVDGSGNYVFQKQEATIQAILCGNRFLNELFPEDIQGEEQVGLVLDRTQFFSGDGGQESDCGTLTIENSIVFDIESVEKVRGSIIHFGSFRNFSGDSKVAVDNLGILELNEDRRLRIMRNHTAIHLLNEAIRQIYPLSSEKFSSATPDDSTSTVLFYEAPDTSGLSKVQKYVRDFILHGVPVKRKIFNQEEYQKLNDVVFIPGEPIFGSEIPVIEINSGNKLSREYCPGTHVRNTSHLGDFVIKSFKKVGFRSYAVSVLTAEKAAKVREVDSQMEEKWRVLEKESADIHLLDPTEGSKLISKLTQLESEVAEKTEEISHTTRLLISTGVRNAKKAYKSANHAKTKVEEEIKKVLKTSKEEFVVHCLETDQPLDSAALQKLLDQHKDKPLLIFHKHEDCVSVECRVPEDFVSETFSAETWLVYSMMGSGGVGGCRKGENPKLTYFMRERKLTEERLEKAMNRGTAFPAFNREKKISHHS